MNSKSPKAKINLRDTPDRKLLLQKADWVKAGLTLFAKEGHEAISITTLANQLGVTKGSFYWHFASRDELLDAILQEWTLHATERVIELVERSASTPREKIRALALLGVRSSIEEFGGAIELAVRNWARGNRKVRNIVAEVDRHRLAYLTELFKEATPSADAELMACLHYSFSAGLRLIFSMSDDAKLRIREDALDKVFFKNP
ncbi:TetR/AcrR family transcriptional regulator [Paraburkholderia caribensis]|uniref:TetR/AcrR family transcriptional regulator n=1 Tax=Paraburkholderia caribensis TaxID=75105 RepID=UPI001CAD29F5|nr:TetR/AcrR family transcriptional regulator [Paraburkholderia caribensis]CAG9262978.1 HTH tetR-type domain-containing protein [Paraburkholderia caribensis]